MPAHYSNEDLSSFIIVNTERIIQDWSIKIHLGRGFSKSPLLKDHLRCLLKTIAARFLPNPMKLNPEIQDTHGTIVHSSGGLPIGTLLQEYALLRSVLFSKLDPKFALKNEDRNQILNIIAEALEAAVGGFNRRRSSDEQSQLIASKSMQKKSAQNVLSLRSQATSPGR